MLGICMVAFAIKMASAGFGLGAAVLWWRASLTKTPSEINQEKAAAVQGDIIPILDKLMRGVAAQSRQNAQAAALAAIAAGLQVAAAFMPTCWG